MRARKPTSVQRKRELLQKVELFIRAVNRAKNILQHIPLKKLDSQIQEALECLVLIIRKTGLKKLCTSRLVEALVNAKRALTNAQIDSAVLTTDLARMKKAAEQAAGLETALKQSSAEAPERSEEINAHIDAKRQEQRVLEDRCDKLSHYCTPSGCLTHKAVLELDQDVQELKKLVAEYKQLVAHYHDLPIDKLAVRSYNERLKLDIRMLDEKMRDMMSKKE